MVRPLLASLVAAAALLLSAGAAGAHTGAAGSEIATAPVATPIVLPAVDLRAAVPASATVPALVAAVVALAVCGSRRRLALALALLSAVVGVDAAVHSVHHLNDPGAAATCVLASGSTHAPAVLTDGVVVAVAPTCAPRVPIADARLRPPPPERSRSSERLSHPGGRPCVQSMSRSWCH